MVMLIIIVGTVLMYREDLDRFNPFFTKEYVYVQINEQPEPDEPDGKRFKYQLTGFNDEGKKRNVNFSTSSELEQGTYLKVMAKGQYTEKWEKIEDDSLPKNIKF